MTYIALLLAIAMVSGVLAAVSSVVSQAQRREREAQLLWAGAQIQLGLQSYARAGDGSLPRRLEDLLEDPRTPDKRRHLRRIYEDPMNRGAEWGLVRDAKGGITGVYSQSTAAPIKSGAFAPAYRSFAGSRRYSDWQFAAGGAGQRPPEAGASAPAGRLPKPPPAASAAAPPAPTPAPAAPVAPPAGPPPPNPENEAPEAPPEAPADPPEAPPEEAPLEPPPQ
ncbi:type II secretion system protein [Rubrivivax sp. A210]|uniref:type II secretion system protein n=1 Tax=Rubrivivax sp. A210 TaxID=2772301 RepID=UPI00191B1A26|nr:type II secretion system protein [Rubrivivax sp. A210]